jgi:hypothetical protein
MSDPNYTYVHGIVTGVLATIGLVGILGGIIFVLLRGWAIAVNNKFKAVNDTFKEVFERFQHDTRDMQERWRIQNARCEAHTAGVSRLEGMLSRNKEGGK